MSERLVVRVTHAFFEDLDSQLSTERGANGEPSSFDFQAIELVKIIDTFANNFDTLPTLIPGRPDYRLLIKAGVLVRAITVVGQQVSDGAIELLRVELDLSMNPD